MKNNENNDQQGKDTNLDPKQKSEEMNKGINKTDSDPSKKPSITNDDMKDESKTKTNDSITRKEHDDTGHNHDYKTPGDEKKNQNNNLSTNDKTSNGQINGTKNEGINKGENKQNSL
jgi:hypothetical protein